IPPRTSAIGGDPVGTNGPADVRKGGLSYGTAPVFARRGRLDRKGDRPLGETSRWPAGAGAELAPGTRCSFTAHRCERFRRTPASYRHQDYRRYDPVGPRTAAVDHRR